MKVTTVGIDLAKNVFSVHGVDERGKALLKRSVSRAKLMELMAGLPSCRVGIEACSGGAYGARYGFAFCGALSQERQERWQRCGGDL